MIGVRPEDVGLYTEGLWGGRGHCLVLIDSTKTYGAKDSVFLISFFQLHGPSMLKQQIGSAARF